MVPGFPVIPRLQDRFFLSCLMLFIWFWFLLFFRALQLLKTPTGCWSRCVDASVAQRPLLGTYQFVCPLTPAWSRSAETILLALFHKIWSGIRSNGGRFSCLAADRAWNWRKEYDEERHYYLQVTSPCNWWTFSSGLDWVQSCKHVHMSVHLAWERSSDFEGNRPTETMRIFKVGLSACTLPQLNACPSFLVLLEQKNQILLSDNK